MVRENKDIMSEMHGSGSICRSGPQSEDAAQRGWRRTAMALLIAGALSEGSRGRRNIPSRHLASRLRMLGQPFAYIEGGKC